MADKGTSLEALGLGKEQLEGTDFENIPENLGQSYPDPVQPGTYRFQFPTAAQMKAIWAKVESTNHGERLNALFEDDAALTIVQSPGHEHDGESYRWRVSNVPRERTAEKILVSDMDLVLRGMGVTARPRTNKDYALALIKLAGQTFTANQEFSWNCNPKKDIYVDDGTGTGNTTQVEGKPGCNARYYQRDVQKVPSNPDDPASPKVYPLRIQCSNPDCGASIRAFGNLTGFKK